MIGPFENLAGAIIVQAVDDYRKARKEQVYYPRDKKIKLLIQDLERFFCSDWFTVLTTIDGAALLHKLMEEEES